MWRKYLHNVIPFLLNKYLLTNIYTSWLVMLQNQSNIQLQSLLFNICCSLLKDSEFFGIFYYFSNFGTILFIIIIIPSFPDRPLLAKISETATLSVTKHHTHVDPRLLSCTRYFSSRSGLPFWIYRQIRVFRFSSISPKLIIRASIAISLNVGLGKSYLSSSLS